MNFFLKKVRKFYKKRDDSTKLILGKQLSWQQRGFKSEKLTDIGFSIFSQWDEDGIIQYLLKHIPITNHFFIEFGVQDYSESNTRFLMMNNNWSGLIIDGDDKNISAIKESDYYWKYDLTALQKFITRDNINDLIKKNLKRLGIEKSIGLLSVDIDGVDYWVLQQIDCIDPSIIICEYNSLFGNSIPVSIPYDSGFERKKRHYSHLYYGANLKAFEVLLNDRSYVYVGSSIGKINAFFVKKTLAEKYIPELIRDTDEDFGYSKVRESRNRAGQLNFKGGTDRINEIKDLELINILTNEIVKIKDLN